MPFCKSVLFKSLFTSSPFTLTFAIQNSLVLVIFHATGIFAYSTFMNYLSKPCHDPPFFVIDCGCGYDLAPSLIIAIFTLKTTKTENVTFR